MKENKCIPKKKFTKYDKNIFSISKCDLIYKNKTIEYEFISKDFCFIDKNDIDYLTTKEIFECDIDNNTNEEEEDICILGNVIVYDYILNLSNKGWYANKEGIFTGIYNTVGEKKELSKYIEITEPDAFITFHIELNLNKGEEFLILINSNITNYYTNNNNSAQKIKIIF